jgi:hypothetical protein
MALMPLKVKRHNEGLRSGLIVCGSNGSGDAAELGWSRRKVMTVGAHLSAEHG